jgi:hypothetical protein
MDYSLMLKAGFQAFALSVGVVIAVFAVAGSAMKTPRGRFNRVFILASIASFAAIYLLLHYKIRVSPLPEGPPFLSGCVGGWLSATAFSMFQLRTYLLGYLK